MVDQYLWIPNNRKKSALKWSEKLYIFQTMMKKHIIFSHKKCLTLGGKDYLIGGMFKIERNNHKGGHWLRVDLNLNIL